MRNNSGKIAGFFMAAFLLIVVVETVILFFALPKGFINDPLNGLVNIFNPQMENEDVEEIYEAVNVTAWEAMKSNILVKIDITYQKNLGGPIHEAIFQGSAVIYREDALRYYCLTNNHVVDVIDDFSSYHNVTVTSTVEDYLGNKYLFTIICKDENYDLAVISFLKSGEVLPVISSIAIINPSVSERVIAIGQPKGQINAVSIGNVVNYQSVSTGSGIVVDFLCIISSVRIDEGSSGGMLIDFNGELIGINTYGDEEGEAAASIPIEKVWEFLIAEGQEPSI